jgi:hypothetical protein
VRFLSLKVAPGVRLSASPRGIRGHLGPRLARVHVGGGGTGISSGAGPLTVYEPLRGSPRKTTKGLTAKQAERLRQVEAVGRQLAHLESLHRTDFPGPVQEVVARAALPKFRKLLATAEKRTLKGAGRFDREARKAKKAEARQLAERWAVDLMTLAEAERQSRQEEIDHAWRDLHSNVPAAVMAALTSAYAASARPVRVVGVEDGEAHLVLRVDGPETLPESKPASTPAGAPTLHKMTKTDRAAWHRQLVASQVLLSAKQAVAAAPGLSAVRIVAVDHANLPLLGARLTSTGLAAADWKDHAWEILSGLDGAMRCDLRGRTQEMRTIDLRRDEVFGGLFRA